MTKDLATSLTENQKAAILTILKFVGGWASMDITGEAELLPEFDKKLKANFELLNLSNTNNLLEIYENVELERILYNTLKSLPSSLIPWFVVETYMMLSTSGSISERAMQVTLIYFDKMGISEEEYLNIIQAAYNATSD